MIFKKRCATIGNFIFANGTKAIFNAAGLYKTEKQSEIDQLKAESDLYEVVTEAVPQEAAKPDPKEDKLAKVITGIKTSAKH